MRAGLVELWPTLSETYGLLPWHVGRLTPDELAHYTAGARAVLAARRARAASAAAARPG